MAISFSAMRKILEQENICDALKGRIRYFATRYRESHDEMGRVAILVDDVEVMKSSWFSWSQKTHDIYHATRGAHNKGLTFEEYWNKVDIEAHNQGGFDQFGFYNAFHTYYNQSIDDSLSDDDPIIRLFAVLDKRIGKRRLQVIQEAIENQPDWLKPFYQLRLSAEKEKITQ